MAEREEREVKLAAIAAEIAADDAFSDLREKATNMVPGDGDVMADIMFIGEAPGKNEDEQGLPFVGRSGKYLEYLLKLIDLDRKDVFITNIVKYRPPDNRDPLTHEVDAGRGYLERQIEVIDPLVIATLGRFSMNLFFPKAKITKIYGQPKYEGGRAYYPFFHPAAALRTDRLKIDMEDDMKRLPEILDRVRQMRAEGTPVEAPPDPKDDEPPEQLSLF